MFFDAMHTSWQQILKDQESVLQLLESQLLKESNLTPAPDLVMKAFSLAVDETRVLLLGQDPYPAKGTATGLAFATSELSQLPASLKNLMSELATDIPEATHNGDIALWQDQGVMLLNASLTTEVGYSNKHQKLWRNFTSVAISRLDTHRQGKLVVIAMGNFAKRLAGELKYSLVVSSAHPSPLSARLFFGSRIFSRCNQALRELGLREIDWSC